MDNTNPKRKKMMHHLTRDQLSYYVGPNVEPAISIKSGEEVLFETTDCFSGKIKSHEDTFSSYAHSLELLPGWNPVTGPVYIENAHPGDCLNIEILDIKLADKGITSYVPNLGMLTSSYQLTPDLEPETRECRISDGHVYLPTTKGEIEIPVAPLIGTISVAPKGETIASFKFGAGHLGNVDCKEITTGNALVLPVNVEGALFGLGDVHAAQGDGEITLTAIETTAEVKTRISVTTPEEVAFCGCPQINGADFIGSIGCHFGNLVSENIKYAYFDLMKRIEKQYGFTTMDVYHLLSQVGEIRVCQLLGDFQAALVRVKKCYLENSG